jgi:hypothetical protein
MLAEALTLAGPLWELAVRLVYLGLAFAIPIVCAPPIILVSAIRHGPFHRSAASGFKRTFRSSRIFARAAVG